MEKRQWNKISRIFDIALTLPGSRRTTYIKHLCAGDTILESEINELLASVEASGSLLDEQLRRNKALLTDLSQHLKQSEAPRSLVGTTVGRWKVVELLGRGGMGNVYKVKLEGSDIHQQGALKILRKGLDTPENMQRFRLEKQILAGLNHPNIANMIEGGISQEGLPYLVMEYVEGKTLPEYCDKNFLNIEQRLKLFNTICTAVQYAHKNLIVHRDLKPENILVTNEGRVKILDFGIAKLLDPDLYEFKTVETRQGLRLMSLDYAAPEQFSGEKVTTSTDLYSLGMLLYELLSGLPPFDFEAKKYRSVVQIIREVPPRSPSQRLTQLSDTNLLSQIANNRSTRTEQLINTLKGDLDAIVLKALRKEPEERYRSADKLTDDINFYLQDKPVVARGEAANYKFKKFMIRHRTPIAISSIFIICVSMLITYYTYQLAIERDSARFEAETATHVSDFLLSLFDASTPEFAKGDTITAEMLLSNGLKQINNLQDQPLLQARMLNNIGSAYQKLGLYDKAEQPLQNALLLRKKYSVPDNIEIANSLISLGLLKRHQGNIAEAESLYFEALSIQEKELGNEHTAVASTLNNLGVIHRRKGLYEEAIHYYTNALNIWENAVKPDHLEVAKTKQNMGAVLLEQEKLSQAKSVFEEALSIYIEHGGEKHPMVATIILNLAHVNKEQQNFEKAETLYRQALDIQNKVHGENSPETAITLNNLGILLAKNNRLLAAEPLLNKSLQIRRKLLGQNHPEYVASLHNLAFLYQQNKHYTKADSIYQQTLKKWRKIVGSNHPNVAVTLNNLGAINKNLKRYSLAEKYFKKALQIRKETLNNDHPAVKRSYERLVELYSAWNKNELVAFYADSAAAI